MTPKKVSLYLVGGSVLAAWLASAAGVDQSAAPPAVSVPVSTSGTETLAEEVQAQAVRLRERLAAAPAPHQPSRNPFAFAPTEVPRVRPVRPAPTTSPAEPPAAPIAEPSLALIGVAEDQSEKGTLRTAIISADSGELLMVRVGEFIGARYRVQAIGADAVELSDLVTGAVRRLALR
jgi:hypothetical protein